MGAPAPTLIPTPFASGSSDVNAIPTNPPPSPQNAASWSGGFPDITMQPEGSGGLPPLGQDFNGILLQITEAIFAQQAGQPYVYDATFSGIITGYNVGAQLGMADGSGFWINTSAGNTTNPDNDGTAAGWVPSFSYGEAVVTSTGGIVTLKPSQWRKGIIHILGALTSNLTVNFPTNIQQWLVVNETTNNFTVTCKTPAGTGIVIPQGGPSSPTGVYVDGTNLYQTQAPLAATISVAPTANSIAQRDNTGQLFATRFNQNSALENPTIGAVFVQNSGADGYLRKITLANFLLQLFSGTVNAANGSITIAGIIIKWGSFNLPSGGPVTTAFNAPFPNGCYAVVPTQGESASYGYPFAVTAKTAANFTVSSSAGGINAGTGYYIAIGH